MRVIGGEWRGRALKPPKWEGLRPTSDRLRETLFNVLGPAVAGARVLDAFAGTGAIGIEALSRGAAHVTFVDADARACRLIAENLAPLVPQADAARRYAIIRAGLAEAVPRFAAPFDLIVLDPPYGDAAAAAALDLVEPVAPAGTRVIVEHAKRYPAPDARGGLTRRRTVNAGDSALSFYERC